MYYDLSSELTLSEDSETFKNFQNNQPEVLHIKIKMTAMKNKGGRDAK